MKTAILAAVLFVASVAFGGFASAQVMSANAVGFLPVKLCGGQNLVSFPFNEVGGNPATMDRVFSKGALANGSYVSFYNPYDQKVVQYIYTNDATGWRDTSGTPAGSVPVPRGTAFFVFSPEPRTISFCGEVPGSLDATNMLTITPGMQVISAAYPCTNVMTRGSLNFADGDIIMMYPNTENGEYVPFVYISGVGWVDPDMEAYDFMVFAECEGFLYISATSFDRTWVQWRPYPWLQ